eukprot:1856685-Rhodomonas_salina.2
MEQADGSGVRALPLPRDQRALQSACSCCRATAPSCWLQLTVFAQTWSCASAGLRLVKGVQDEQREEVAAAAERRQRETRLRGRRRAARGGGGT